MHRAVPFFLTLVSLPLVVAFPASAETKLALKEGVWETTTLVKTSGLPTIPPETMARLTPEQRTMMQERMKTMANRDQPPRQERQCIKQKDIEDAFDTTRDSGNGCKRTITTSTNTVLDIAIACEGEQKGSGKVHVEAASPEHVHGTTTMTMGPMHMDGTFTSQWISADCGTMKGGGD